MINENAEADAYQSKYGYMSDYISCAKQEKSKVQIEEDTPDFSYKKLMKYLQEKDNNQNEIYSNDEEKQKIITQTAFMIEGGFNVCIHGIGSKKNIIEDISSLYNNIPKLIVQGYSPASQLQQILKKLKYIVNKVLGVSTSSGKRSEGLLKYLQNVEEDMEKKSSFIPYILIVFHNLDASQYLESDQIVILSKLFNLNYVRVVCSIDHIKYPLVITPKAQELFNFSFLQYNSHECYLHEFKVGENTFSLKKEEEGKELKFIMRSLTKVQKEVIEFVAKYIKEQIDSQPGTVIQKNGLTDSGKVIGLTFKELLEMLIDEMVLNNEHQLKENLLEILDHKVFITVELQQKTYYTMNYGKIILDKIIDQKLEEDDEDEDENGDEGDENDIGHNISSNNSGDEDKNQSYDSNQISDSNEEQENEDESEEENIKPQKQKQLKNKVAIKKKGNKTILSSDSSNSQNSSENESEEEIEYEKPKQKLQRKPRGKYQKKVIAKKSDISSSITESEEDD